MQTSTIYLHVFILLHSKLEAMLPMPIGWHFRVATSLVTPATCNLTFIDSSLHVVNEGILKRVRRLGSVVFFLSGRKMCAKKCWKFRKAMSFPVFPSVFCLCFVLSCLIFWCLSYVFEWFDVTCSNPPNQRQQLHFSKIWRRYGVPRCCKRHPPFRKNRRNLTGRTTAWRSMICVYSISFLGFEDSSRFCSKVKRYHGQTKASQPWPWCFMFSMTKDQMGRTNSKCNTRRSS